MPLFSSISEIFASLSPRRQSADPRQQTSLRNPSRYSSPSPSPTAERPARRTRSAKNQISSGSPPVIDPDGDDGHLGPSQQPDLGRDTITAPAQVCKASFVMRGPRHTLFAPLCVHVESLSSSLFILILFSFLLLAGPQVLLYPFALLF